jgi:hypothetical protein
MKTNQYKNEDKSIQEWRQINTRMKTNQYKNEDKSIQEWRQIQTPKLSQARCWHSVSQFTFCLSVHILSLSSHSVSQFTFCLSVHIPSFYDISILSCRTLQQSGTKLGRHDP